MISLGTMLLYALPLYVAAGMVFAFAFVLHGATRVLEHPAPVSAGARVLLFPASTLLWPLILRRWLKAPARP